MDDLTTERTFNSHATWVIDVLNLFFDVFHGCLRNQSLEVLTSVEIECLYCSTVADIAVAATAIIQSIKRTYLSIGIMNILE